MNMNVVIHERVVYVCVCISELFKCAYVYENAREDGKGDEMMRK